MSKKQSRKEQAEMNARVRSATCKMWFETSRTTGVSGLTVTFGLVEVPVEYLSHPAVDIADRKRNAPHVKVIEKSMTVHGIMKTDVVVLIWLEDILAAGLDPKNIVFAPLNLINNKPPVPMYVIAGDHTALAAKNMHIRHPRNKQFSTISVSLLVSAKNEETKALAKLYGGLDNKIKDTKRTKGTWEYVEEMHNHFTGTRFEQMDKEAKKKWWEDFLLKTAAPLASVNSWKVVAQRKGELWENINAIMTGNATNLKPPKNTTFFNGMSGIPDRFLIQWSKRVVDGEMLPREFQIRCLKYKKQLSCQQKMLAYVNILLASRSDLQCKDYNDLCTYYPFFKDGQWFNSCVGWMTDRVKDDLVAAIKESIVSKMTAWDKVVAKEQVLCFCYYLKTQLR